MPSPKMAMIFSVTLAGQVTLLAGAGPLGAGPRGNDDGPALEATFSVPNGIRASPDGDTHWSGGTQYGFGCNRGGDQLEEYFGRGRAWRNRDAEHCGPGTCGRFS